MYEREKAIGQFVILKKQVYALAVKSQALVKEMHDEIEAFFYENDISRIDFRKIETLSRQLQEIQTEFNGKASKLKEIQSNYNIME